MGEECGSLSLACHSMESECEKAVYRTMVVVVLAAAAREIVGEMAQAAEVGAEDHADKAQKRFADPLEMERAHDVEVVAAAEVAPDIVELGLDEVDWVALGDLAVVVAFDRVGRKDSLAAVASVGFANRPVGYRPSYFQ